MAHQAQRHILVMRHAQRQDEVDDGWASAEAARLGGRPWDPPLSSPTGLAQAEEAAAKLAAWERRTGARIVAVVTSPFLRCLQTAAAACRRLGLQQLRVSWAVSEALYRIADIPPGPLPRAMWPRAMGEGSPPVLQPQAGGGPGGLSAEEFLAGLGAEVAAEVALSSPQPADKSGAVAGGRGPRDGAAAARRGGGTEERRGGNGEEEESAEELPSGEGAQRGPPHIGRVLKGFRVTILPPPLDPVTLGGAHGGAAASDNDLMRAPPGPSPDSDAASGSQYASAESEGVAEDLKEKGEDAERVALLGGGLAAPPKGAPLEQSSHLPSPGLEEGGDSGAGGGHRGGPQRVEHGPRVDALPYRSQQGPGGQCVYGSSVGAAAAAVSPPVYGVPYSPETLEAAHVRYRAALRCLMAAAAAAATAAEDPVSSGGAAKGTGGRAAPPTGAHAPPTHVASSRPPVTAAAELTGDVRQWLGPWCALWQAGTTRRAEEGVGARASSTAGGEGGSCDAPPSTAEAGEASSSGAGPGAQSPEPATGAAAASPTAGQLTGDGGGSARTECGTECCSEGEGDEDYDEVRQLRRQPISQLDTPPPHDSMPGLGGRRRQQSGEPRGEAVLVVTHGEAVACAAATAAPWALVYEVRHTGFVVLAAGEGEADEEEGKQYGGGGGGGGEGGASPAAVWELLPDPHGERGVLWMSALDD